MLVAVAGLALLPVGLEDLILVVLLMDKSDPKDMITEVAVAVVVAVVAIQEQVVLGL
jgi:hypothetical protein